MTLRSVKRGALIALGIAAGAALLSFALMNQGEVTITAFLLPDVTLPVWMLVLACIGLGWIVPRLLGVGQLLRWRKERATLHRRIKTLEREVVSLRNIPLDLDPLEDEDDAPVARVIRWRSASVDVVEPHTQSTPLLTAAGESSPQLTDESERVVE